MERGEGVEEFIEVFGKVTVEKAILLLCATLFLWKCYSKVSVYFRDKSINDYNQNKQIQEVIDQSKNYPIWRRQSIQIQEDLKEQIQSLSDKMDNLSKSNGEGMAYTWRYRILRFNDEIIQRDRHTKEHFDQILEDIDNYEKFCENNPKFSNNKAVLAVKNIKDVYDKCVEENSFL